MLIHCSSLGKIMTEPRLKADKEAGNLSETAKSEILQTWIYDKFGKYKDFENRYTSKGNECEEEGITMLSKYWKTPLFKNEQMFMNDFLIGTPDLVEDDFIADIKCPYDLQNFMKAGSDDYYEQLQAYMELTKKSHAFLVYCLIDAPEWIIDSEIRRIKYNANPDLYGDIEKGVRENLTFNNVPADKKVKIFELNYDPEFIAKARTKHKKGVEYYNSLTL